MRRARRRRVPAGLPRLQQQEGLGRGLRQGRRSARATRASAASAPRRRAAARTARRTTSARAARCSDGKCTAAKKSRAARTARATTSATAARARRASARAAAARKFPRVWVGARRCRLDFYVMPGAQNVCSLHDGADQQRRVRLRRSRATARASRRTRRSTRSIVSRNRQRPGAGRLRARPASAHGELRLRAQHRTCCSASRGLRVARRSQPGPAFAPVHLEGRFTYLFGKDAVTAKIAPMVFAGVGAGEFDAFVPVNVFLNPRASVATPTRGTPSNAWLTAGPIFAAAGGGVRLLLSKKIAATGALKLQGAFGGQRELPLRRRAGARHPVRLLRGARGGR